MAVDRLRVLLNIILFILYLITILQCHVTDTLLVREPGPTIWAIDTIWGNNSRSDFWQGSPLVIKNM